MAKKHINKRIARKAPKLLTADEISKEMGIGEETRKDARVGMRPIESIRNVLFAPYDFFAHLARGAGLDNSASYLLLMAAIPAIYGAISYLFLDFNFAMAAAVGAVEFVIVVLLTCAGVAITHMVVRLFGGKEGLAKTFKTAVYAGTPWFIFASLPIAAIFALAWSVYLQAVGHKETQKIGWAAAFIATALPILVGFGVLVWIIVSNPALMAELQKAGAVSNVTA